MSDHLADVVAVAADHRARGCAITRRPGALDYVSEKSWAPRRTQVYRMVTPITIMLERATTLPDAPGPARSKLAGASYPILKWILSAKSRTLSMLGRSSGSPHEIGEEGSAEPGECGAAVGRGAVCRSAMP